MCALSPFQTLAWLPLALLGLDGFCGLRLGGEEVVDDGSAKDANVRDGAVIPVGSSLLCLRRPRCALLGYLSVSPFYKVFSSDLGNS